MIKKTRNEKTEVYLEEKRNSVWKIWSISESGRNRLSSSAKNLIKKRSAQIISCIVTGTSPIIGRKKKKKETDDGNL